ncbi:MAG TPA: hypothetical protein VL463_15950 [Kofleriaceae bacterium]|nr:hypothetical protein [Kofleriaceae bacterium]
MAVALIACGTPAPSGPADAHLDANVRLPDAPLATDPCVAPIAIEDLGRCLDRAWCARLAACGHGQLGDTDCGAVDARVTSTIDARTLEQAAVTSFLFHRAAYDPDAAGACVAAIAQTPCRSLAPNTIPIDQCAMFTGLVQPGNFCGYPYECAGDADCVDGYVFSPACGQNTCRPRVAVGMTCSTNPCVPGAHCVSEVGFLLCESGEAGSGCWADADCDDGFWCQPSPMGTIGACVAAAGPGEACDRDRQCGARACVGAALGSGMCVDTTVLGAPCDSRCLGPFLCARPDPMQLGACVAAPAVGDPCLPGAGCGDFLRCGADDHCTTRGALGATCAGAGECDVGLVCTTDVTGTPTGTCVAPLSNGTACVDSTQCASGACTDHVCDVYQACAF